MRTTKILIIILFIAIVVSVAFFAGGRRSHAAPQVIDRWWVGSSESGFNYDHVCKDGIAIWGMTRLEEQGGGVSVYLYNEEVSHLDRELLVQESVQMVDGYGKWTINWPYNLEPGTKIDVSVGLPGASGTFHFISPIRDCYVPLDPQEELGVASFDCIDGLYTEEECSVHFYQNYFYRHINIPIAEDECRDFQINVHGSGFVTHLDLSMEIESLQTYDYTIYLKSPLMDGWVTLVDKEMPASDHLGNSNIGDDFNGWVDKGWNTAPFILDDDSSFDLTNGAPPFNSTSFVPNPGMLSSFIGENPFGIWYLLICNHTLPPLSQAHSEPNIGGPRRISNETGSIFKGARLRITTDNSAPTIFDTQGYPQVMGNKAIFQWKTDDKSVSTIRYGTSPGSRPFEKHDDNPVTDHNVILENLNPDTNYYYVIEARNQAGIVTTSEEMQFATKSEQFTLNININGQGTLQRDPDMPTYQSGEMVTLTAVPVSGHYFAGWGGDASGTANPIQITMNSNKSVTASFAPVAPNTYTLNTPSSVGGSIDRNPDKQTFQSGEVVILTAVPANGYQFDGWTGDASGMGNPLQITMDSNKSVGATFTPIESSDDFIYFMPSVLSN